MKNLESRGEERQHGGLMFQSFCSRPRESPVWVLPPANWVLPKSSLISLVLPFLICRHQSGSPNTSGPLPLGIWKGWHFPVTSFRSGWVMWSVLPHEFVQKCITSRPNTRLQVRDRPELYSNHFTQQPAMLGGWSLCRSEWLWHLMHICPELKTNFFKKTSLLFGNWWCLWCGRYWLTDNFISWL